MVPDCGLAGEGVWEFKIATLCGSASSADALSWFDCIIRAGRLVPCGLVRAFDEHPYTLIRERRM